MRWYTGMETLIVMVMILQEGADGGCLPSYSISSETIFGIKAVLAQVGPIDSRSGSRIMNPQESYVIGMAWQQSFLIWENETQNSDVWNTRAEAE